MTPESPCSSFALCFAHMGRKHYNAGCASLFAYDTVISDTVKVVWFIYRCEFYMITGAQCESPSLTPLPSYHVSRLSCAVGWSHSHLIFEIQSLWPDVHVRCRGHCYPQYSYYHISCLTYRYTYSWWPLVIELPSFLPILP